MIRHVPNPVPSATRLILVAPAALALALSACAGNGAPPPANLSNMAIPTPGAGMVVPAQAGPMGAQERQPMFTGGTTRQAPAQADTGNMAEPSYIRRP